MIQNSVSLLPITLFWVNGAKTFIQRAICITLFNWQYITQQKIDKLIIQNSIHLVCVSGAKTFVQKPNCLRLFNWQQKKEFFVILNFMFLLPTIQLLFRDSGAETFAQIATCLALFYRKLSNSGKSFWLNCDLNCVSLLTFELLFEFYWWYLKQQILSRSWYSQTLPYKGPVL